MRDIKFYKSHYDYVGVLLLVIIIVIILLSGILMILFVSRGASDCYANSMDGTLIRLIPIDSS
jgi:hypothetical protein